MAVVMVLLESALVVFFLFNAWFEILRIEYDFTVVKSTMDVRTLIPDVCCDVVTYGFVDGVFI